MTTNMRYDLRRRLGVSHFPCWSERRRVAVLIANGIVFVRARWWREEVRWRSWVMRFWSVSLRRWMPESLLVPSSITPSTYATNSQQYFTAVEDDSYISILFQSNTFFTVSTMEGNVTPNRPIWYIKSQIWSSIDTTDPWIELSESSLNKPKRSWRRWNTSVTQSCKCTITHYHSNSSLFLLLPEYGDSNESVGHNAKLLLVYQCTKLNTPWNDEVEK